MSKPGIHPWHNRVINALLAIGSEYGFETSTGIVYYKIGNNRFEYHPDVLWLYNDNNRFKPNAYVWEIESRWSDLKRVTGDSTLAFMMRPEYTTFFKRKEDTKFGRTLKKDEKVPNYYGATRATYYKNFHKKMNLNASGFMLVVEHQGNEDYWQRYVHSVAEHLGFWGKCAVISIPRNRVSIDDVKHRLAHLESVRKIT